MAQQKQASSQGDHCPRVGCWDLELAGSPGGSHSRTSACRGAGGGLEVLWATCKFESRPKVRNPASSTAQSPSGIVQRILVHTARTSVRKPGACSLSSPGSRSHLAPLCHSSSFLYSPHLPFLPPKLNSTSGPALPRLPPQSLWASWAQRFISAPPFRYCRRLSSDLTRPTGKRGSLRHSWVVDSPQGAGVRRPLLPARPGRSGGRARTTGEPSAVPKTGSLITLCLH